MNQNDNRTGGMLLVAGSVAGLITMGFHPVGPHGDTLPPPQAMQMLAFHDRAVHALGLASVPVLFLGAMALTRWLSAKAGRLPLAALVVYGFAAVALVSAGAMDGFVSADILSRMVAGDPKLESRWMMLDYTFRINQAFAAIYLVASCVAIVCWSLTIVRTRKSLIGLGIYGLVLGPGMVLALFGGWLSLNVHGFGLVVILQSLWYIVAGTVLMREQNETPNGAPLWTAAA